MKALTRSSSFIALVTLLLSATSVLIVNKNMEFLQYMFLFSCIVVVLLRPIVGIYLLLFSLPLQNLVVLEDGSTMIRWLGAFVFGAWLVRKLISRDDLRLLFHGTLAKLVLCFLWLCTLSFFWSNQSLWLKTLISLVQLIAFFFMVIDVVDSPFILRRVIIMLLLGCLVNAGLAVASYYTNPSSNVFFRAEGGFGDPNNSAAASVTVMPLAMLMVKRRQSSTALFGMIALCILIVGVGVTVSRTGALLAGICIVSELFRASRVRNLKRFQKLSALLFVLMVSLTFVPWDAVANRFHDFRQLDLLEVGVRGNLAVDGINLIARSPLLGLGLGREKGENYHNLLIGIGIQLGVLGIIGMLAIIVFALRNVHFANKVFTSANELELSDYVFAVQMGAILHFLYSMTVSNELTRFLWIIIALCEVTRRLALKFENEPSMTLDLSSESKFTIQQNV